jgi:hypothetical protein
MRRSAIFGVGIVLLGGVSASAMTVPVPVPVPVQQNGWLIYGASHTSQTLPCAPTPILLTGSHTDTEIKGACTYVRLSGDHNDVAIGVAAGGTIEITGAHNDVTWHQVTQGPPPRLINQRDSNTFHRGEG